MLPFVTALGDPRISHRAMHDALALTETWYGQAWHRNSFRGAFQYASLHPQRGQTNSPGQRESITYWRHASSEPKRRWKSRTVRGKSGSGTQTFTEPPHGNATPRCHGSQPDT
jgi:hypothetical protein